LPLDVAGVEVVAHLLAFGGDFVFLNGVWLKS
jgi:hypothetical protein